MVATLEEIEREVASRLGPYRMETVTVVPGASTFGIAALRSTISLGGLRDLYVLRRDRADADTDRVRLVKEYTPSSGMIEVDFPYTAPVLVNDVVEFHHLHPQHELRHAVYNGLRRCFFMDEVEAQTTGAAVERDLTAMVPWITEPIQVTRIGSAPPNNDLVSPTIIHNYRAYTKQTAVYLTAHPDPYPNTLRVRALRPVWTYYAVAGVYDNRTTLPVNDDDRLPVDLGYAAAAGHIEAWRVARERLFNAARTGLFPSQEDCAKEFTLQSQTHLGRTLDPDRFMFTTPFSIGGARDLQRV